MGIKESFSEAGILVKVAFVASLVSLFSSWIAFTTTSWITSEKVHLGLWRICYISSDPLINPCIITDGSSEVKFGVTQAFSIIGFICQNIGVILIIVFIFKDSCKGNKEVGCGSAVLFIISAIGWLIAVAIFGAEYKERYSYVEGMELHYSYGLAVVACILGLASGIVMFLGGGTGSVRSG